MPENPEPLQAMTTDAIETGKYFGIHQWSKLRHAALRLALMEAEPKDPDWPRIHKICGRFKVGAAFNHFREYPDHFKP